MIINYDFKIYHQTVWICLIGILIEKSALINFTNIFFLLRNYDPRVRSKLWCSHRVPIIHVLFFGLKMHISSNLKAILGDLLSVSIKDMLYTLKVIRCSYGVVVSTEDFKSFSLSSILSGSCPFFVWTNKNYIFISI